MPRRSPLPAELGRRSFTLPRRPVARALVGSQRSTKNPRPTVNLCDFTWMGARRWAGEGKGSVPEMRAGSVLAGVRDLTDQLLQHVLEEHHAAHGALRVYDPGQVGAGTLHRGQDVLDLIA